VTRERLVDWLIAVLLACLGGGAIAIAATLALRAWLNAWDDGVETLLIAVGWVIWAVTSAAISAFWLRRSSRA
jgi:hypothetical protein